MPADVAVEGPDAGVVCLPLDNLDYSVNHVMNAKQDAEHTKYPFAGRR